jgi:hypothetical protein
MQALCIVLDEPELHGGFARRGGIGCTGDLFPQRGLDEALGLAVGLWPVEARAPLSNPSCSLRLLRADPITVMPS